MLIIPLAAIFSALTFRTTARAKGYRQAPLWTYPLLVGSAFFAASLLVSVAGGLLLPQASFTAQTLPLVSSWTALLLMFAVLGRAWKHLRALPSRNGTDASSS